MEMVEVKTAELIGPALDWAVGIAIGASPHISSDGTIQDRPTVVITCGGACGTMPYDEKWSPSKQWSQCGPLIEEHIGELIRDQEEYSEPGEPWYADCSVFWQIGQKPLIAACRAIVAAKLGDVVSVPAELIAGQISS